MTRIEEVARRAWPNDTETLLPLNEATTRRILTAALTAAEASPQLTDRWLRAACEQARQEDTP